MATYLAKRGRRTSNAVARTLFEISPDDFGLGEEAPPNEAELVALTRFAERMRAKPANDAAMPAACVAAAHLAPEHHVHLPVYVVDAAVFEHIAAHVAREHGWTVRKCEPGWIVGHYTPRAAGSW